MNYNLWSKLSSRQSSALSYSLPGLRHLSSACCGVFGAWTINKGARSWTLEKEDQGTWTKVLVWSATRKRRATKDEQPWLAPGSMRDRWFQILATERNTSLSAKPLSSLSLLSVGGTWSRILPHHGFWDSI
jgi:hypothetical protein